MDLRIEALLSVQRALWDVVTPGLRGVAMSVRETRIQARFVFDHDPDESECEDVTLAETSMVADFFPRAEITFEAVELLTTEPRVLEPGEEWVYLRKEHADEWSAGA
ncbi:hypothetical protein ARHIZOSPH14_25160 [Agromyces rhizosphaerae]|uniref:Uncharacterized protein n=1 Tax=Agromyces rhizosphaerae TaxID=88374 RepID=A0A9W6FPQ3_9MICO|nr:hypothetical protein [Agromyces rhizosphaerae]GLI28274.1 hypothetical protein ARHIZOSPH14_25160 [Agromyces rhizosphaerae]